MNIAELKRDFPFIHVDELKYELKNNSYKTERGFRNHLAKLNDKNCQRANKPDVVTLTIKIDWKCSATWGSNPHARAWCIFADKTEGYLGDVTVGGCGYDKESTVVSRIFNEFLSGMAWRMRKTKKTCLMD